LLFGDADDLLAGFKEVEGWAVEEPSGSHPASQDVVSGWGETWAATTEVAGEGEDGGEIVKVGEPIRFVFC
jgi:hypothetical protein